MKKVFKRVWIAAAVMVTAFAAGALSSCTYDEDPEDKLDKQGYSYRVTYDANGGTFGSNTTRTYALVKENSLTPAPGYVDADTQASVKKPTRRNYEMIGEAEDDNDDDVNDEAMQTMSWFVAKTDENGNIVYEGEGDNKVPVLVSNEPWNFMKDRVTEDVTLVAMWKEVYRFSICLVDTDEKGEKKTKEVRRFDVQPGDTIVERLYKKDKGQTELIRRPDYINFKVTNYTLLDFYLDEAFATLLPVDYAHPGTRQVEEEVENPETGEKEMVTLPTNTVTIYIQYLAGKYEFITNNNTPTLTEESNWYFLEHTDFKGKEMTALSNFKGTIYGNGYAMKNFVVKATLTKPSATMAFYSMFGNMNGIVENLTMQNATLKATTPYGGKVLGEHKVSFIANTFGEKASMKNVTLQDCQILKTNVSADTMIDCEHNGGLWWTAPADGQTTNITVKIGDGVVDAISVVTE